MTPDELLRRYPRETLRWLRRRLGLTKAAFAARVEVAVVTVESWETGRAPIRRPATRQRLVTLLAPQLATEEGAAWLATMRARR